MLTLAKQLTWVCTVKFHLSLKQDDRRLFHDRLRTVDRRISPALSKLTWQRPRAAQDAYFNEAMWCVLGVALASLSLQS